MKKIILITDALGDPRVPKRRHLLEANGYETELYGFARGYDKLSSEKIDCEVIGDIANLPYFSRILILFKGIRRVLKRYRRKKDVCFYLFGIQVALIFKFLSKQPYIYEEADLVHTYIKSSVLKKWFEKEDKKIIRHSKLSVFTSDGFIHYHFPNKKLNNCIVIANKLKQEILLIKDIEKNHFFDSNNIQFGFVGAVRFEATINFIEYVVKNYPQHVFHIYGIIHSNYNERIEALKFFDNFIYHGSFKNPTDLPDIYSNIDFVLATYDTEYENVRYAEPNKLYESIFFRTPIIVSHNTLLSSKVQKLGCGVSVNALDSKKIDSLLNSLTIENYNNLLMSLNSIDKSMAVDSNEDLANSLKTIISEI